MGAASGRVAFIRLIILVKHVDLKTALMYMQNLGVSLNDDDSEALDTLCDFVDTVINRKALPMPDPARVMWQYGIETRYYTEEQMLDFARAFAACFSA